MILAQAYPYTGNGLGGLPDAIEAITTHEINGQYELYFRYPVTGLHYEELLNGRIVMAAPDDLTDEQPFRIYRITKPLNGVVTVYARHIAYDMSGIVVEPFTAGSMTEAFQVIPTKCTPASPITISTLRSVASPMTLSAPRPLWRLLGGQPGSLLDVYGGEWNFDKLEAKLVTTLGTDRGVQIRYGKNLTELEQDTTIEETYSGVYPFWYDEDSNTLVTLPEKVVDVTGSVVTNRVMTYDCSDVFDEEPTEQQLRDRTNAYIAANSVGNLTASWKVSFVDAPDFPFDKVMLGDVIHVFYEAIGVNATARAVKTEYDVLAKRYKAVTIGRVKQNLAAIIVNDQRETDSKIKTAKSFLEQAIDEATYSITHGGGVFRAIYDGYNLKEIVSLDDPDITQALSVWRWNNGGFGHSSTGYNGQYALALLPDGSINAEMITTGILNANIIRAGILQDAQGKNSWNLQTGEFNITNGSIHISTNSETNDYIGLNYTSPANNRFYTGISAGGIDVQQWMNYDPSRIVPDDKVSIGGNSIIVGYSYYQMPNDTGWYGAPVTKLGRNWLYFPRVDTSTTPPTMTPWLELSGNTIQLYDNAGTRRQYSTGDGKFWQYDSNGKKRTYLEYGDIFLYDASEKKRLQLSSNGVVNLYDSSQTQQTKLGLGDFYLYDSTGAQRLRAYAVNGGGRLELRDASNPRVAIYGDTGGLWLQKSTDTNTGVFITDTSDNIRTRLGTDGLKFFNSSGTLTAQYPATGTWSIVGNKTGATDSLTGVTINLGVVTASDMGIADNASASVVAGGWLSYCTAKYPNAKQCIFEGVALANSYRMMRVMIYDTSDKSGIQPKVASGTMQFYNGDIVVFGANNYNVWTRNVTMSAQVYA